MNLATGLMRYGQDWRMHRRLYKEGFRATVVPNYQDVLSSKAEQFVTNLRQNPNSFVDHIRTYSAATIMATVYGYDIAPTNDRFVDLAEQSVGTLSDAVHPSTVVVNVLPFLRHLPLKFPIFMFQRIARRTRGILNEMRTVPYDFVKNNVLAEKGKSSFLAKLLEDHTINGGDKRQEEVIKDVVTTAYVAGADTTVSALVTFVLAMALHPEIQKRAQNNLDVVVGKGRLPTYADCSDLPYIEAVLRETLRWSPVVPLGIFHASFVDDMIDGHFIPKGTTVISNIWAMTRDETVYPEPESFIPDRFLTEDGTCNEDEMMLPFGFGRRICAGLHFARLTVWMALASILSQFDIGEPEDETGRPIKSLADIAYSDGLISHTSPFRCAIKPRMK
ncbi:hypothetical protein E1B28_002320 [Marasmius oreades]|uniref:Cytochrome P450 n=1 Tax=Marasmius oreades TaxID=181124 RepID=A0A9P7ULG8_9AGAR|nr:uncharacterized protein E1B28_002320 [Marasmius oreades]KAG7086360.1 hypothetical protein E1B28_002320 [Marasmius oreades]